MVFYTANSAQKATVSLNNTRHEAVHVIGVTGVNGLVPILIVDDNMVKRNDFTHDYSCLAQR